MADIIGSEVQLDSRTERARRAVKVFRGMQPQLTAYARSITKNKKVRVQMAQSGQSSGYTDGDTIYFIPPVALGDMRAHQQGMCDRRDNNLELLCEACNLREEVLTVVYHEIAHICYNTFSPVTDQDKVNITRLAVEEGGTKFAEALMARYNQTPSYYKNSYKALAALFNEFLPIITNSLEDARVNRALFAARPGTKIMFEAKIRKVFTEGVEQMDEYGQTVKIMWKDYPLNLQVIIGCYCILSEYKYDGWFHPAVEADLRDVKLNRILRQMNTIDHPGGVYNLAFKVLQRLRELGYCKADNDPEPEPEEEQSSEEEPAEQDGDPGDGVGEPGDDDDEGSGEGEEEAPAPEPEPDAEGAGSPDGEGADAEDDDQPDTEPDGDGGGGEAGEGEGDDLSDPSGSDAADEGAADREAGDGGDADDQPVHGEPAGDSEPAESGDGSPDGGLGEGESPDAGSDHDASGDDVAEPDAGGADGMGDGDDSGDPDPGVQGEGADAPQPGDGGPDAASAERDLADGDEGGEGGGEGQPEPGDDGGAAADASGQPDGGGEGDGDSPSPSDAADTADGEAAGAPGGGEHSPAGDRDGEAQAEGGLTDGEAGAGGGEDHAPGDTSPGGDGEPLHGQGPVEPGGDELQDDAEVADGSGVRPGGVSDDPREGDPTDEGVDDDVSGSGDDGGPVGQPESAGADEAGGGDALGDDPAEEGAESAASDGPGEGVDGHSDGPSPDDGGGPVDPAGREAAPAPGPTQPIDTGADKGLGGIPVDERPEMGTATGIAGQVAEWLGHGERAEEREAELKGDRADEKSVGIALSQGVYFETPSENVGGVIENKWDTFDHDGSGWSSAWVPTEFLDGDTAHYLGFESEVTIPESVLGPALLRMRVAFAENKRAKHQRHLKGGKINAAALGKRAALNDPRLFKKTTQPGKLDYFVAIAMDVSGSNAGESMLLLRRAVMAQAELLNRLGVRFAIFAHSTGYGDTGLMLDVYWIKEPHEPWSKGTRERLLRTGAHSGNLDGHAMEFLRKVLDKDTATSKIGLYYSDGKMPAANHDEELEVLQREIKVCARSNYTLLGVGIRTDSPREHGLDTVQVDGDADVVKVVRHIEKRLTQGR